MSKEENGPKLTIVGSCLNCKYSKTKRCYGENDYSELDWYCNHPAVNKKEPKYIGASSTPQWCPLLDEAMAKLHKDAFICYDNRFI